MVKVADHCTFVGVRYKYSDHFDKYEEMYRNASNMTALSKCFKKKSSTIGGKGSNNTIELQKQQEEAARK